ncbi:hypothetical protein VCV18_005059 [Metarhizium anisopliae]
MVLRTAVFRDDVERPGEKFSNLVDFLFASKSQVQRLAKGLVSRRHMCVCMAVETKRRPDVSCHCGRHIAVPPRRFGMVLRDEQVTVMRSVGLWCRDHMAGR